MKKKKIVYVGFSADILHSGHINLLRIAHKYGNVIVGLLTDKAISRYKKLPHLNYNQRFEVIKNIKFVKKVIPQNTLSYLDNLKKIKPDIVVHGDDWKEGVQKKTRNEVIRYLKKTKGKLVEPGYTAGISSSIIKKKINSIGISSDTRKEKLKRLIEAKDLVRVIEAHNPLSGIIAELTSVKKDGVEREFDAIWSSSLTDSTVRGKPDNQSVDYATRLMGQNEILEVTNKPIIFDGDNGGRIEHLPFMIRSLERLGVSAVVLEDKKGLKKNSLFVSQNQSNQDSISSFRKKIITAKKATVSDDFLVIARIESLIFSKGVDDALKRAISYSKAGADCIFISCKEKNPKEIFEFSKKFQKSDYFKPLVAVPSTYSKTYEKVLIKNGFRIVIYANQLLRSSYPAMKKCAEQILKNQRSFEAEKNLISIKEILTLIKH